ncbi:hypothetical protein MINS_16960 [Mycolicibacterium insubricum]|uniref:Uncharacterized protein n=1 Tax=Mycolicibacterium insubricum TaxID=444597 RepID=A0A1X0D6K1_9MYCO|nr:hypothetical protein BST26_14985 [Mycolicibacterium insubricum]BBZ66267.1 hypothetical protein MINS_16960 [Mycolicibacterium insubricum]
MHGLPEKQRQHSLLPLLHDYRQPARLMPPGSIPVERFREAVRAANVGSDGDIPHITADVIVKYTEDLGVLGLL